jgi:Uma2 family endonuclease
LTPLTSSAAKHDTNAVINPTLLVEVTSSSTEDYDRGEKLSRYKQCPSVEAVLFVSHRRPQVSVVQRTRTSGTDGEAEWHQREYRLGEQLTVESLGLSLVVDEIYAGIVLESA